MYSGQGPLKGRKCYQVYQQRDSICPWCPSIEAIRTGNTKSAEVPYPSADDPKGWILLSAYPVKDDDDIVRGVIEYVKDITERRRAEEQLRESEARFRALFNNAAEGILVADIQSRYFIYANPAICRMLGYTEEEIRQLTVNDIHPPEALEHTLCEFEAQARAEKILASDIPCLRKDGSVFYADINTSRVELEGRAHNIGMFADVTVRRNAEMDRQRMQRLESLGTVAGGLAHDFNNLLMGVFGNIEMAKLELPAHHSVGIYLESACNALERARQLTGQLLTFAKGGAPVLETVATEALVKETVAFNLSGSNVLPHFDLQEGLWPVKADKGQISQVLANLIINAKQAMPHGGVISVVGTNLEKVPDNTPVDPSGQYVRLSIRDEGSGIPGDIIDRVFDPYFTTKKNGSGLGLAIAHSIITRHGGFINVDSGPAAGTAVTVLLPADPSGTTPSPAECPQPAEQPTRASMHILFMDDNEAIRNLAKSMLGKIGCRVEEAANGEEALQKYVSAKTQGNPFDLLILDLTVPGGMGGKDTLSAILAIDDKARAIVSSGYSADPVIANYQDYGFSGCLVKPFIMADLKREIERVMESQ